MRALKGVLNWGAAAPCLAASLLIGCGGGGGGGYNGSTSPMPTVNFTTPSSAASINFGQGVSLSWTSTYVSSCMGSTSSATAGAFSGNQPLSGLAVVAPTAAGSATYTLTCLGSMGGTATATTAVVTVNPAILSTLSTAKIAAIGS